MSLLTFLLGPKEYGNHQHEKVMGPQLVGADTFEVILYVRDGWYKRFPRLTRHDASMYHIRKFTDSRRFQVLPIDADKIIDSRGRKIKNPTFEQIVQMWWYTSPFAQLMGD